MADQTSVEFRNGKDEVAARRIFRNVSDCAADVVALTELQTRLVMLDLKQSGRQAAAPGGLLLVGIGLLVGAFPVLLMAIAYALINGAGWPEWAGFLFATAVGFVLGGSFCAGAYWLFRNHVATMERSRKELGNNLRWLKDVLSASGRARHFSQCE